MKSTAELRVEAEQRMRDKKAGLPAGRPRASPAASVAEGSEIESLYSTDLGSRDALQKMPRQQSLVQLASRAGNRCSRMQPAGNQKSAATLPSKRIETPTLISTRKSMGCIDERISKRKIDSLSLAGAKHISFFHPRKNVDDV